MAKWTSQDNPVIVGHGSTRAEGANPVRDDWSVPYRRRVALVDVVAMLIAVGAAYGVRFAPGRPPQVVGDFAPDYLSLSLVIMAVWLLALAVNRSRDRRVVGFGPSEYQRVFDATWRVFAAVALASYLFKWEIGRGYLAVALPLGGALLLVGRFVNRQVLHRRRRLGEARTGVLVIGPRDKAATLIDEFHAEPASEYLVVGVCVPAGAVASGETVVGVPVLGAMQDAVRVADVLDVRMVAVAGADVITSATVRRLGWDLEGRGIDLALTTTLLDVAGPRVLLRPMNNLPLLYVDEPRFSGAKYVLKTTLDWAMAFAITLLIVPLLIGLAVLVKVTSPGPAFYVQQRIGRNGRPFAMFKFRSMVADAHDQLGAVLASEGVGETLMFYKPKHDPRVTRLGRFIRKYSLDELPQLLNVLLGEMSLVGPRPQIADEVALYDRTASRRLLVKPGLTGLWQVSGRSALTPEESIRLDVRYVENWSIFGDLSILARTARAMVTGDGAR